MMRAVARLAGRRLARRWPALVAAGLLVGFGFGVCLASISAARRTDSAYDRILADAHAPDASVSHGLPPAEANKAFGSIDGVVGVHTSLGFVGTIDGVDPALARAMLGPIHDRFPVELPRLRAGRLPDPHRVDEVFVNDFLADHAGLHLGQRLDLQLLSADFATVEDVQVRIVGIGSLPREAVIDETAAFGLVVFSPAFAPQHPDLVLYASTGLDLAPGVDARRDLAAEISAKGGELQEVRSQEKQAVDDALRPLITLLFALGLLAFVAATVVAGQIIQRDQERWRADDDTLRALGMVRTQVVLALLTSAAVIAAIAVVTAMVVLFAASPLAPFGPLHSLDPAQGVTIDLTVAAVGAAVIVVTIAAIAVAFAVLRRSSTRSASRSVRTPASLTTGPAAQAGLMIALRSGDGRRRARRSIAFATVAVILTASVGTLVTSAVALSEQRDRYGFDWDLLAVSQFGDQPVEVLQTTFGDDPDVVAATGFTGWTFLIDSRAVPGLAATRVKGDLGPTILRGRALRSAGEIVVGQDTLEALGVDVGDRVRVRVAGPEAPTEPTRLQVVGVATFPPVSQTGTDQPRLGTGALVTRTTFDRMFGRNDNQPEWTAVRLADGVDPAAVIARHPDGIPDARNTPTSWYTDAKPAELRQLDSVRSVLLIAIAASYLIALAVIGHALWSQTRSHRRDIAVLKAIGFTRRRLAAVSAWQAVPLAIVMIIVGIPIGVIVGRRAFASFASSLAVVDQAPISVGVLAGALVVAILIAVGIGVAGATAVATRTRPSLVLREE